MKVLDALRSYNVYEKVFVFSFIPLLIKMFNYLFIGVFYPMLIGVLLMSPFLYCYWKPNANIQKAITYWGIMILCYGVLRVLLNIIIRIDSSGVPSGDFYQFTFWYALKSVGYCIMGILLLLKRKKIFLNISQ
ncbi:hypothetical protein [Spongiimicrobium salis]|uniref:hypothetical protein n=1 Tax=Spongiimicrobium salis TaxID=1667022 RepID=UPI00374D60B7